VGQLELLWHLQNHDRKLKRLKLKLANIEKREKLKELQLRLKEIEYDVTNKKTQRDVDEVKIQRYSNKLEQLNFNLKEIEKKLYGGNVKDVRQLTYINKEAQELKKEIIRYEKDTINLMEEVEKLDIELTSINEAFQKLNHALKDEEKQIDLTIKQLKLRIVNENKTIEKIKPKIEEKLMKEYMSLKERKGKAIAEVFEDKCNGCHMSIPLSILNKLRSTEGITYCDNCGRILYFNKDINNNN